MAEMQTISITAETAVKLQEIAEEQSLSHSDVIKEALDEYSNYLTWFKAKVQKGLDDIENGRTVSYDEVKEKYKKLGVKC